MSKNNPNQFDVAIIGAGAAGMMCAAVAGQRGRRVVLIDHAGKLAEKIRISGGGRCNFTNVGAGPQHYLSQNPHFCRSALSRYTPQDFIGLVKRHRIGFHEKHKGQLFCDDSAEDIIAMLKAECEAGNVSWRMPCTVQEVGKSGEHFRIATSAGEVQAASLVIATGGLSIPKIGATDFAYRIARQTAITQKGENARRGKLSCKRRKNIFFKARPEATGSDSLNLRIGIEVRRLDDGIARSFVARRKTGGRQCAPWSKPFFHRPHCVKRGERCKGKSAIGLALFESITMNLSPCSRRTGCKGKLAQGYFNRKNTLVDPPTGIVTEVVSREPVDAG